MLLKALQKFFFLSILLLILMADLSFSSIFKAFLFGFISTIISYIFITTNKSQKKFEISIRFFYYIPWLLKEIFVSSMQMIKIILTLKSLDVMPVVDEVNTKQQTDEAKTLFANSITLTPGTIAIKSNKNTIDVHAISKYHMQSLKKSPMDELTSKSQKNV